MLSKRLTLLAITLLFPLQLMAIQKSGTISANETWTDADSPVMVEGLLFIDQNATVIIRPGVVVRFAEGAGMVVEGKLQAVGAPADSIYFTAATAKAAGAWGGIYIRSYAGGEVAPTEGDTTSAESILEYCVIEFAGSAAVETGSALEISASSPRICHSSIRNSEGQTGTIKVGSRSKPVIENCEIAYNEALRGGAISASLGSYPILKNSRLIANKSGDHGGGVYISLASMDITGCAFIGNEAQAHGGAIYCAISPNLTIEDNSFVANKSEAGSNIVYLSNRITSIIRNNVFDNYGLPGFAFYLETASQAIDATDNYWGDPETFTFTNIIRDRNISPSEPFVNYLPYLWAPPAVHPTNPLAVDSIILCRDDNYSEEIPRGVAEGAPLRIRLAGVDSNPLFRDLIQVKVHSAMDPEGILMALVETDKNSGVYVNRGRVAATSDQNEYAIGDSEGGEIHILAPDFEEVEAIYQTMSPKPLAEEFRVELADKVDNLHLTDHKPVFHWNYFDVVEIPQKKYQITVSPGTETGTTGAPVWNTGEVSSNDKTVTYAGSELEDGKSYVCVLKVWNAKFWSDPVTLPIRMNSVPTAPVAIRPTIDELADTLKPQLAVKVSNDKESDTLTYRFELYEGEAATPFSTVDGVMGNNGEVVWTAPEELTENATYRLRVKAFDHLEGGEWGEERVFHINATEEAPLAYDLEGPIGGGRIYLLHPMMNWSEAVDPDPLSFVKYRVDISKTADFAAPKTYPGLTETSFELPDSLDNETKYFWRIKATDNTNRETYSKSVGEFTVYTTPSIPVADAPMNGEERQPQDKLTWAASEDPNPDDVITYEVSVFPTDSMTNVVASITGLSEPEVIVSALGLWEDMIDNKVYYWHVQARDNHNAPSGWSETGSFFFNRYNDAPDSIIAINAPPDTVMGTTDIVFRWDAVEDPDLSDPSETLIYELECTLDSFEGADVRKFESDAGVATITAPLDDNKLWSYRIRARDDDTMTGPWSATGKVLVNEAEDAPTAFALLHPHPDSLVVELDSLTFSWEASSDPDWESSIKYRLELTPDQGQTFTVETADTRYTYYNGLTNELRYYWKVTAVDNIGMETPVASGFAFSTSTTPEQPMAAEMPAELMPPDPLVFTSTTDPNQRDVLTYTVEISPKENFEPLFVHVEQIGHNDGDIRVPIQGLKDQEKLEDDMDYYFRVRATDNHGYDGAFSEPHLFRFNRVNDAPFAATPEFAPKDTFVVRSRNPVIEWGAASDEDLSDPPEKLVYDIRLDKDWELENNATYNYTTNPGVTDIMPPNPLQDNTPWVWQVRAKDDDGAVSAWSDTYVFLMNKEEDAPSVPQLTYPGKDATLNILGPIDFKWEASTDPDWRSSITYIFEYGVDVDLRDGKRHDGLIDPTFHIEGPLENTTYYWRVIAVDNTGLETESEIYSVKLDTKPTTPNPISIAPVVELTPDGQLQWTLSEDPNPDDKIKYELSISIDVPEEQGGEATTVSDATSVGVPMSDILGDNMFFNWRVRAVDNHGVASEWSDPSKFFYNLQNDPPNKVEVLNWPESGVELSSVSLSWEPTTDVDFSDTPELLSYKVELSQDETFENDVLGMMTKPNTTTLQPSGLQDNTRWYWRVRGVDDDNAESEPSPVRNFIYNTRNDAPEQVTTLIAPADGAEVSSAALSWEAVNDVDLLDTPDILVYKVELSLNSQFTSGVEKLESRPGSTSLTASTIADDAVWYWRVSAMDDDGATGTPSAVRSFTLNRGNDAPSKVMLSSPSADANVKSGSFSWQAADDQDVADTPASLTYQLEVSTSATFGGAIKQTTAAGVTSATVDAMKDNTLYHWRVRAVDQNGAAGEWSDVRKLAYNTANDAPGAFNLSAPANGSSTTGSSVTLSWTKSVDPDPLDKVRYTVHVAKDAGFTTAHNTFKDVEGLSHQMSGSNLSGGGTFYWKVVAEDGNGGAVWGSGSDASPWSFQIPTAPSGQ